MLLIHFISLVSFYTPENIRKTSGFFDGIETNLQYEMV